MLFVTDLSVVYSLDDKFLFNKDTGLYLACHQVTGDYREMPLSAHDGDFWWYVGEDGQAKSFTNGSVCLKPVSDVSEMIEDEDVPVRRADALIEQALNSQLSSSVPEPEPEVPEPEPEVPEPEPEVPEVEPEVPEVEPEVPEVEPEVPEVKTGCSCTPETCECTPETCECTQETCTCSKPGCTDKQ